MKKAAVVTLVLLFGLFLAANVVAAEKATKDECVAKTKEAAKLYSEKGEAATIKEINNKQGKFVWKDTYVFMTDLDGKMLAHPIAPPCRDECARHDNEPSSCSGFRRSPKGEATLHGPTLVTRRPGKRSPVYRVPATCISARESQ
jgi:hypothetical protein